MSEVPFSDLLAETERLVVEAMTAAVPIAAKLAPGIHPLEVPVEPQGSLPGVSRQVNIRLAALVDFLGKIDAAV